MPGRARNLELADIRIGGGEKEVVKTIMGQWFPEWKQGEEDWERNKM